MWRMKATLLLITAVALVVGCGKKASPTSKGDDSTAKLKEENRKLKTENEKLRVETEAARLKAENAQLKAEKARMEVALTNGSDSGVGKEIRKVLGWCSAINIGVLMVWFLAFVFARDFVFRIHTRWFKIPEDRFDEIHYTMMGYYKLAFGLFNLVPYLALRIAS